MDAFRHLGLGLRILREHQGKGLRELAATAGVGKSQLSKYENGKELPKLASLGRILRALSVTPEEFFSLTALLGKRLESLGTSGGDSVPPFSSLGLLTPDVTAAFERVTNSILELHHVVIVGLLHPDTAERKGRGGDSADEGESIPWETKT